MKIKCLFLIGLVLACASMGFAQSKTMKIKVYLVALEDKGKTGKKIGCDDSLVPVTRKVAKTTGTLKAAIVELLAIPNEYNDKLRNFWGGNDLKVKSVSIKKGTATINLTGEGPSVAGVCDEPRITTQIEETAKQFSSVKKVKVFVNGKTLQSVIE
jgi:spore germination protein GerM